MQLNSFALIATMLLAGCAHQPERPKLPEKVFVTVEKLVPVDDRLTQPCTTTRATSRTVEAVVSAYNANLLALQDCNTRMGEIRALGR
ncbi:TPA: Rz1-like lysis system protein LysC [Stenotrophomonas maltophilia]